MEVLLTFVGCFTPLAALGIALYYADRAARKRTTSAPARRRLKNVVRMKKQNGKTSARNGAEMRPEYDLRQMKLLGVGEHFKRMAARNRYVQLEPDVATVFTDAKSVNDTLCKAMEMTKVIPPAKRRKLA